MDALRQTVVVGHVVDMQIFHADDPVAIHKTTALLVRKVISSPSDPLMHTGDCLALFAAYRCAFGKLGMLALHAGQGLLFFPEETRVLNLFSCRKCGKGFE